MRRNLFTLVIAAGFMLGATAAFANNWTFDDAYWKQPTTVGAVPATQAGEIRAKYDQVDGYNP